MSNPVFPSLRFTLVTFAICILGVLLGVTAEAAGPVSVKQCDDMSRDATRARHALMSRIRQCATDSSDRKWGVIGSQGCASWVPRECEGMVQQCEAQQRRADIELEHCRTRVAALRDQLREEAKEGLVEGADRAAGGGVRAAAEMFGTAQRTRDGIGAALDFFGGKQTAAEQYSTVSDAAHAAHGMVGGSAVSREYFDRSIQEINTVHLSALAQLDAAIAATTGIRHIAPTSMPAPRLVGTPDPAVRAREEALRAQFTANQQRLEQQQLAMVREREAMEARERAAREAERERERELAEAAAEERRAVRKRAEQRRLDAVEVELAEEREYQQAQRRQRNQQNVLNAVNGAMQGIMSMQQRVDSYRSLQRGNTNGYGSPSYGGSSSCPPVGGHYGPDGVFFMCTAE